MKKNLSLNANHHAHVHPEAVSDKAGTVTLLHRAMTPAAASMKPKTSHVLSTQST